MVILWHQQNVKVLYAFCKVTYKLWDKTVLAAAAGPPVLSATDDRIS